MKKIKVLNIAGIDDYFKGEVDDSLYEMTYRKKNEVSQPELEETEVLIGNPSLDQIRQCKNLRFLQLSRAGSDDIKEDLLPRGCLAANASGTYGIGISEYMIGATLMMMRNFHQYIRHQELHKWQKIQPVSGLYEATVLVVGSGDIGLEYAKRCKAMGSKVIGIKRHLDSIPEELDECYDLKSLDTLLPRADVVALSLPNSAETQGIMGKRQFELMKQSAFLINVGRGTAVNTEELCDAVLNHEIAGACLDVFEAEPLRSDHRIWDIENIIITPHCSGNLNLKITNQKFAEIAIGNLENYRLGRPIRNEIDFETGYRKYKR